MDRGSPWEILQLEHYIGRNGREKPEEDAEAQKWGGMGRSETLSLLSVFCFYSLWCILS